MLTRSGRIILRAVLTGFLIFFPAPVSLAQTVSFSAAKDFPVGDTPTSVAIADLNLDGKLDLVVTNGGSNTVSVLLGSGDGTFGTKVDFATGQNPESVVIGDLNLDGNPDLAVANHFPNRTISVLLGDGTGAFGAKTDHQTATVGNGPRIVTIGDLNNDGKPDIAVASDDVNNPGKITVFLGDGTGSFGPGSVFLAGVSSRGLAIADLNGDGNLDLATANAGTKGTASVLLGNGTGGFSAATDFPTGSDSVIVAIADLNLDGKIDLAVANNGSADVSILLGDGIGSFGPTTNFDTASAPTWVAIGDLNGDGKPDLAAANMNSDSVSVLLGDGSGGFAPRDDFATGAGPSSVAIGDVNGDGKPDLAVANRFSDSVSVLLNVTLTAKGLKEDAISELDGVKAAILGGAPGVGDVEDAVANLDEAIAFLEVSLGSFQPGDPNRLIVAQGEAFFANQENAVEEIFDAVDSGVITNPALLNELQNIIVNKILEADKIVVQTAIEDAIAATGNAVDIADAQFEFATAEQQVADGVAAGIAAQMFLDDAVGSFEDAWINAQRAVGALP